ncbi:hypothetical protein L288_14270 [Sphingobium quisquiliarum P25]|uniref:HTH tetR-type domain-containing protein n=1 Tax=Sphingobium quisquiliarum P25 TaxID=1329909 RepID=T0HY19_9SPHN|nr:TetR/AcrR family transcriptional regulator C-terminal domain-containing protein [Sphingobium quisquiliarum]EQB04240.1 hypothetical protein L288_14270 [Sphingobium quisquiliarum P25]
MTAPAREQAGKRGSAKREAAEARKAALLEAARALLEKEGFHDVSLNEILRHAGGSKATVVKYFGNRNGLLAEALASGARQRMVELFEEARSADPSSLRTGLEQALSGLLRFYLQPEVLRTYRAVSAGAGYPPELARAFYANGHGVIVDELVRFLEPWRGKGLRRDIDLPTAVSRLTHMLRSNLFERALYGILPDPPSDEEIKEEAVQTARLFLDGAMD